MQTDWIILPYVGVGQLKLGMTPDEVAAIVGPPEGSRLIADTGEFRERRKQSALQAVYAAGDRHLVELGFSPPIKELDFGGVPLFTVHSDDALRRVLQDDPSPLTVHGFVVFFGLGITMTGFDDDDEDQKAVTIFEEGRWDAFKPEMQKFVFLGK
jgi:hypothetical protein